MDCPKCGGQTRVYSTNSYGTTRQRYRLCKACGHRMRSWEECDGGEVKSRSAAPPPAERAPDLFDCLDPAKDVCTHD